MCCCRVRRHRTGCVAYNRNGRPCVHPLRRHNFSICGCECGLGSSDACDYTQTVVTGIVLSHTGTLSIPVGESRVVYATVKPATAAFQWVEWTVDNNEREFDGVNPDCYKCQILGQAS